MAVCYALCVTALALVTGLLRNAGTDAARLAEEGTLELRVEPLVDHNSTSLLSGMLV